MAIWLEFRPRTNGLRTTIYTLSRHRHQAGRRADEGSVAPSSCREEPGEEKPGAEATAAVGPRPEARVHTNNRELYSGQFLYHTTERSGSRAQRPPTHSCAYLAFAEVVTRWASTTLLSSSDRKVLGAPPFPPELYSSILQQCLLSSLTTSFYTYVPLPERSFFFF